jgi:hypothetical protein
MQSANTIEGWLADVSDQGMHTYKSAITANLELQQLNPGRKRRVLSRPTVGTHQKKQK